MFNVVCVYAFMIKLEPTCFNLNEFSNHSGLLSNSLYRQQIPSFLKNNIILGYKKLVLLRNNYIVAMFACLDGVMVPIMFIF